MAPTVHIEYWYRELAGLIKTHVPDAIVSGKVGRSSSFEVTVNDMLVYSKLESHAFPDNSEVVEMVKKASAGGEVQKVKKKKDSCLIQ
ncbi:hypothetical protein ANANG_G00204970 [Anguilla anguilla]|uniref:Uncharacterized protein n=1 Tax=Anguilla anguilla TaxID=7936 RepID=A0A9D3M0Q3_ANGAN|nr:hypothetical protein ANANG_G00204970 [Anguilla anguilla]